MDQNWSKQVADEEPSEPKLSKTARKRLKKEQQEKEKQERIKGMGYLVLLCRLKDLQAYL